MMGTVVLIRTDPTKCREAIRSLDNELLMIEATGDYGRGKALLDKYGRSTPEILPSSEPSSCSARNYRLVSPAEVWSRPSCRSVP